MAIEIKLIGFGDVKPVGFNHRNRRDIDIETPASVRQLLQAAGLAEAADLIAMDAESVIPPQRWDEARICDRTTLTFLSAIEGG